MNPHTPPEDIESIMNWYSAAQVNYVDYYIKLYIAYNAWYRQVTGSTNDRQALDRLKKRFIIWDDYKKQRTLQSLRSYMEKLAEYTQREPFPSTNQYWEGSLENVNDWRSLIEFWYQVRCRLVHGSLVKPAYVWLAYQTLDIFMEEIITRMKQCFTDKDHERLDELREYSTAGGSKERFRKLQEALYQKYIASPNIWQVDMQRVHE
jgi:hypothetical protein